jgi:hypothetical protein
MQWHSQRVCDASGAAAAVAAATCCAGQGPTWCSCC